MITARDGGHTWAFHLPNRGMLTLCFGMETGMPVIDEKTLAKLPNERARQFYRSANAYREKNSAMPWYELRRDSQTFDAWSEYFKRLGWSPAAFKAVAQGEKIACTMPCEWPEWMA